MAKKPLNRQTPQRSQTEIPEDLQEIEEDLVTSNPEIFKGVSPKKKMEILHSISSFSIHQRSHSGPLPDAETLIKYDSVIPNGADRIMKMAEIQQSHRMNMEDIVIRSQSNQSKLGQIFGLIIGIIGILSGTYLASKGEATVGGIIAGGTVVSLVSVFVIGKTIQKNSLDN